MKKVSKILSVALSGIILISITFFPVNAEDSSKYVYLGGQSFGVKFYADGAIIVNLENYFDGTKYICPAKESGLKINDVITEAEGKEIKSNEDLQNIITESKGESIELKVKRNNKEISKIVTPAKNVAGMYLIGAWIRDSCAGLGTITYYDETNNSFAALGHGICDSDTSILMPLSTGETVEASISGISKSTSGKAGSLNGYFTDTEIGILTQNTVLGIYGTINENYYYQDNKIELANTDEIRTGKAEIYTTIENSNVDKFDIEITKICNNSQNSNENFVIKITDEKLINSCGGIVQGMSGSHIVQNGKIVGAVTHVFVNEPIEGYGIAIQNMVANYKE